MLRNTRSRTVFGFRHHFVKDDKEPEQVGQTVVKRKSLSKLPSAEEVLSRSQSLTQLPRKAPPSSVPNLRLAADLRPGSAGSRTSGDGPAGSQKMSAAVLA